MGRLIEGRNLVFSFLRNFFVVRINVYVFRRREIFVMLSGLERFIGNVELNLGIRFKDYLGSVY